MDDDEMPKIRANGGASLRRRAAKRARVGSSPSTSMKTPSLSLPTQPARPRAVARRCAKGRKPTPWTTPVTRIR